MARRGASLLRATVLRTLGFHRKSSPRLVSVNSISNWLSTPTLKAPTPHPHPPLLPEPRPPVHALQDAPEGARARGRRRRAAGGLGGCRPVSLGGRLGWAADRRGRRAAAEGFGRPAGWLWGLPVGVPICGSVLAAGLMVRGPAGCWRGSVAHARRRRPLRAGAAAPLTPVVDLPSGWLPCARARGPTGVGSQVLQASAGGRRRSPRRSPPDLAPSQHN